jgi:NTP pyrophosphatase (non-canonical NTP hydrolase)
MNKFESNESETSHEEYEDLVKYYEDLEAKERSMEKVECGPHIEEFEELLTPLLEEEVLEVLSAIETEEEALNSEERESAKKALIPIVDKMKFLDRRTDITEEELDGLRKKYKIISNAVGMINNGTVDHDR